MDILERLKFDAVRCEATFSKGVASNLEEAVAEIERLRTALRVLIGEEGDGMKWSDRIQMAQKALEQT